MWIFFLNVPGNLSVLFIPLSIQYSFISFNTVSMLILYSYLIILPFEVVSVSEYIFCHSWSMAALGILLLFVSLSTYYWNI